MTREAPATSAYHSLALIRSILNIMFLHLPMRQVLYGLVESCVSHPWGCLFLGAQELTSLMGKLNLATMYSGRRRSFSRRCYKRTCKVITVICLHTLETFLPEYEYHYSLSGNNKFVLCHGLGPI